MLTEDIEWVETDALHWAFDGGCKVRPGAPRKYAKTLADITCNTCLSRFDPPVRVESKDHRPSDMAELAQQVAKELRAKGIRADTFQSIAVTFPVIDYSFTEHESKRFAITWTHCSVLSSDYDNLGPRAIAALIQAEEVKRAQEWAGDK